MSSLSFNLLQEEIDYVLANQDWSGAFEAYTLVNNLLENSGLAKKDPTQYKRYVGYLMKLKFLSLNYFDDVQDYYDLLKNYFSLSQEMPELDLWQKLEAQLLSMRDLAARDKFKDKLREALEKSDDMLISRQKYNDFEMPYKVGDWIKDFVANLGLENFDKLEKMEYLSRGKHVQKLDDKDKNKIKNLLDFYEKLKLSSRTPEGYENLVLMDIDGKKILFNRGKIEEVNNSLIQGLVDVEEPSRKELTDFVRVSGGASLDGAPSLTSSRPSAPARNPLVELEDILVNYAPESLEHKAISQEISRLKSGGLRQAQQAGQVSNESLQSSASQRERKNQQNQ